MLRPLAVIFCLAAVASAQPIFELQSVGPFPVLPLVDVEGIGATANAGASQASIQSTTGCGLPIPGSFQYAHLAANGDISGSLNIPTGGPIPRAAGAAFGTEIQIPIPPGANGISFTWEFFDAENSATYNDAFQVAVVDPMGAYVGAPIVYMDCATILGAASPGTCSDPFFLTTAGTETGAIMSVGGVVGGPQMVQNFPLPTPLPPGSYISVMCANDQDNAVASTAIIDDVSFTGTLASWIFGQIGGPGSTLDIGLINCPPNVAFLMPVSINNPGIFPNGWCLGVDLDIPTLLLELNFGAPFIGSTDASGTFLFPVPPGVLPIGMQLNASCGLFNPNLTIRFNPTAVTIQ
jgi:hypothetical protein